MKQTFRTTVIVISAMVIVGVFTIAGSQGGRSIPPGLRLAGARPVIEADRCVSIQAAIDALPDEGGVVRLPPGTFEIYEPLKITKSDVLIEGAGTATHIKNVNTEGKSALIIQHPSKGDNRQAELWRISWRNKAEQGRYTA